MVGKKEEMDGQRSPYVCIAYLAERNGVWSCEYMSQCPRLDPERDVTYYRVRSVEIAVARGVMVDIEPST